MTVQERNEIAALAADAGNGSPEACAALYKRTVSFLRGVCARYFHNAYDIDDALQDTYVRIFRNLSTLESPDAFLSWSRTVAQNTCLNILRSRNLLQAREILTGGGTDDRDADQEDVSAAEYRKEWNPEAAAENQMTAGILLDILDSLTDGQRSCILLWAEGYTYKAIAQKAGLPLGTVRSTIHYTRKKVSDVILKMEKEQGIRLHGMAPIPYFLWLLEQQDAGKTGDSAAPPADSSPFGEQMDSAFFSSVMKRLAESAPTEPAGIGGAFPGAGRNGNSSLGAVLAAGILLTALLFPAGRVILPDLADRYTPYDTAVTEAPVRSFLISGRAAGSRSSLSGPDNGISVGVSQIGRGQPESADADASAAAYTGGTASGDRSPGIADFHFERHTDTGIHPEKESGVIPHTEAPEAAGSANETDEAAGERKDLPLLARPVPYPFPRSDEAPAEPAPDASADPARQYEGEETQLIQTDITQISGTAPEAETQPDGFALPGAPESGNTQNFHEVSAEGPAAGNPEPADQTTAIRQAPASGQDTDAALSPVEDSGSGTEAPEESVPQPVEEPGPTEETEPAADPVPAEEPTDPEPQEDPLPSEAPEPENIPIQWFQFLNTPYEITPLEAYEPRQLLYEIYPPDATEQIQWNTTRADITVDENGVITFQPEYLEEGGFGMAGVSATTSSGTYGGGPWFKLTWNSTTDTSGVCGDNVFWYLDGSTLVIYGSGPMYNYSTSGPEWGVPTQQPPWVRYIDQITAVDIQEGVTVIGADAFSFFEKISGAMIIPEGVVRMEGWAFQMTNVTTFYLPKSLQVLELGALAANAPPDVVYAGTEEEWNMISIEDPDSFYSIINSLTYSG